MGPMSYQRLLGGDGHANVIFIAITQQPHSIINFINKHESIAALWKDERTTTFSMLTIKYDIKI